ncbi:MAG: hypothetical protein U0Q12_11530 [Vicinamibacterales bacterium]
MPRVGTLDTQPHRISGSVDGDGWPLVPPTLVTVHRTSRQDEGTRQIVIAIDGVRQCQLLYGQRVTRELLPGRHTMRVHNTLFWKTFDFDVEPGGHAHFTVWNRSWGAAFYFYIMFVGPPPLLLGVAKGSPDSMTPLVALDAERPVSLLGGLRRRPMF